MNDDRSDMRLHAVALRRGDLWVVQCLEYDIATQAQTISELEESLLRLLAGHIELSRRNDEVPFSRLPKAPPSYWEKYHQVRSGFSDFHPLIIRDDIGTLAVNVSVGFATS